MDSFVDGMAAATRLADHAVAPVDLKDGGQLRRIKSVDHPVADQRFGFNIETGCGAPWVLTLTVVPAACSGEKQPLYFT